VRLDRFDRSILRFVLEAELLSATSRDQTTPGGVLPRDGDLVPGR
jgi:hypothetical protein